MANKVEPPIAVSDGRHDVESVADQMINYGNWRDRTDRVSLTALTGGLTNDGEMTHYLLLFLRHQPGDDPLPTK